jgi:hypothetical protein
MLARVLLGVVNGGFFICKLIKIAALANSGGNSRRVNLGATSIEWASDAAEVLGLCSTRFEVSHNSVSGNMYHY